jgi:tetratricopeptide (TPR) repeat protein
MSETHDHDPRALRQQAERHLLRGRRDREVIALLDSLLQSADQESADALFARRQLAELLLERSPWRSALHLRDLIKRGAADDGVHSLMGLCQALLGNYRMAVSAYRRALSLAPRNPWYHHNLGHLLDVGLGAASDALPHLQMAHDLQSEEDEITASLAHCLARLGELEKARAMATQAVQRAPGNGDHRALLEWVEKGAPERRGSTLRRNRGDDALCRQVHGLLRDRMREAGFTAAHVRRAQALWSDFVGRSEARVAKPAVYAAAIEYAIAKLDRVQGVTQAQVARRYGVAAGSISSRYGQIRTTLALEPRDPRY